MQLGLEVDLEDVSLSLDLASLGVNQLGAKLTLTKESTQTYLCIFSFLFFMFNKFAEVSMKHIFHFVKSVCTNVIV